MTSFKHTSCYAQFIYFSISTTKTQKSQNNLEYGQNNSKTSASDFLVTNEHYQQPSFETDADTNLNKLIGLSTNSTESFIRMKQQQQQQQPGFREIVPNFDDQFQLHVQPFNPYKARHTLSIDLSSKIASKLQGNH